MSKLFGMAAALLVLIGASCSSHTAPEPSAQERQPFEYRIGPEDTLSIDVWQNSDISRQVMVRPDGMISLPLLDDVRAAGLTPEELRDVLVERLEVFIPNVQVSVIVTLIGSMKVSVLGAVNNPGRYTFIDRITVLDALAMAGGLKDFAARKRIVIKRQEGQVKKRFIFDFDKANKSADVNDGNFDLKPGDIIMVP